jgi:hypothetical protein
MLVVKYINKQPHTIDEVATVKEFYNKYMKPNRVTDIDEYIKSCEISGWHLISRHSSNTGYILELIK